MLSVPTSLTFVKKILSESNNLYYLVGSRIKSVLLAWPVDPPFCYHAYCVCMEMEDKVVRSYLSMRPRYVGPVTAPKILEHKVFMVQV